MCLWCLSLKLTPTFSAGMNCRSVSSPPSSSSRCRSRKARALALVVRQFLPRWTVNITGTRRSTAVATDLVDLLVAQFLNGRHRFALFFSGPDRGDKNGYSTCRLTQGRLK